MSEKAALTRSRGSGNDLSTTAGLLALVIFFLATGVISWLNTRTLNEGAAQIVHSHEVIATLDEIMSLAKDAETGQRGYLLTGNDRYLEPYNQALGRIEVRLNDVERLTQDNPEQQARLPAIKEQIGNKLRELSETIALRRQKGLEAALSVVTTDRGKAAMDALRLQIGAMEEKERELRTQRLANMDNAFRVAVLSSLLTGLLGVSLSAAVTFLVRRANGVRERREWLQAGQVGLNGAMTGNQGVEQLGQSVLKFLAEYLDAHAGAIFVKEGDTFRRVATYGIPADGTPEKFGPGDRLLGQAVLDRRTFFVRDVPDGYLTVGSALGSGKPRQLVIAPAMAENAVNAVLELGLMHPIDDSVTELLATVSEEVGVAVRAADYRAHLQNLLEETQRQAEELQAQGEELRVSNEELEEQSHALKESQSRLEQQQMELEQTNLQLQDQASRLELQRDDITRANESLQVQARELDQASRYKSNFLANMSHELRTPLNSSLILAKLLADNPQGNLTAEQVKYADTIQMAGKDLLALINDILDLSKIEAGRMELQPEPFTLDKLTKDLARIFEPLATQKGLQFRPRILPGCPDTLNTDRQRLEQVLKNLLSNSMKFTEQGKVELTAAPAPNGRIAFAVADTGIGIPEEHQQSVFEAFRQADGTTSRKFGGTGLGLSISRELTRLLGGDIHLASESGKGSTFTVSVPVDYQPLGKSSRTSSPIPESIAGPPAVSPAPAAAPVPPPVPAPRVEDDRERLSGSRRVILVVEDDVTFARILSDLAHELDFQCLIATTAEEALSLAAQYVPSAVILDVVLPDHSGLTVLDRLKHDRRTRHIPVHVVSGSDATQRALSLGAVGYLMKPVQREELVQALKGLEMKLAQRMRRVLVVEDDSVQRESLRQLLGSHDVETVGVGTAAECLEQLRSVTFDCMVLDLSLPDASGHSLLEKLSREDAYSFPPVIVYTGRELEADEEQRLRRYSKSIIIKGAKSPERLLDEVTLFLHQVESELPAEQRRMLEKARSRDAAIEGHRILIVEDDVRNVFAVTSILEPRGAVVQIARNGREALEALDRSREDASRAIDLVLMDVMMPEMDGLTATREIRKQPRWQKLPIIILTAKAMKDDQERCLDAGANDYVAKPLDVEKLLSLIRVWMPR